MGIYFGYTENSSGYVTNLTTTLPSDVAVNSNETTAANGDYSDNVYVGTQRVSSGNILGFDTANDTIRLAANSDATIVYYDDDDLTVGGSVKTDPNDEAYVITDDGEVIAIYVHEIENLGSDEAGTPVVTISGDTTFADGQPAPTLTANVRVNSNQGTLSYQWYKGSVADANKVGTNSATYAVPSTDFDSTDSVTYYVVVTNTFQGNTAQGQNSVEVTKTDAVITGITVTAPTKDEYHTGETLDADGLTVLATYSDGSTAYLDSDAYTIENADRVLAYDAVTAANNTVTYTVHANEDSEVTDDFTVTVIPYTTATVSVASTTASVVQGGTTRMSVSIDNYGTLGTPTVIVTGSTDDGHVTVSISGNTLTITADSEASTSGTYTITIPGTAEDGSTSAASATVTLTVTAAS